MKRSHLRCTVVVHPHRMRTEARGLHKWIPTDWAITLRQIISYHLIYPSYHIQHPCDFHLWWPTVANGEFFNTSLSPANSALILVALSSFSDCAVRVRGSADRSHQKQLPNESSPHPGMSNEVGKFSIIRLCTEVCATDHKDIANIRTSSLLGIIGSLVA